MKSTCAHSDHKKKKGGEKKRRKKKGKKSRLQQFISVITYKLLKIQTILPIQYLQVQPSSSPPLLLNPVISHTKCGILLVPWLLTITPSSPSGLLTYEMSRCQNNFPHFLLILLPFPNPFTSYPSAFHIKSFNLSNHIIVQNRLRTSEIVTLPLTLEKHCLCEHQ